MNICGINRDYMPGCKQTGGVKNVWLINWERTEFDKGDADIITSVSSVANPTDPITRYYIGQKAEWSGLTGSGVYNDENDTVYVEDQLSVKLSGWLAQDRQFFSSLRRGSFMAIVESNSGTMYIAGLEIPGHATEDTNGTGTSMEDRVGGTITLTFKSTDGAYILDADCFTNDFADYVAPAPVIS
jgi:hypothetical protein